MQKPFVFLALLALGGCQTQASSNMLSPLDDAALFEVARKQVLASMRDPDSTKFGIKMFRKQSKLWDMTPVDVVCGTVNSRNGFGGFTGMKTFVWRMDGKVYISGEGDPSERLAADLTCNT